MTTKNLRRPKKIRSLETGDRDGVSAVELAFILPVFFLMILACVEFIRMNMIRNLVQDAAYFAARDAMVPGATAEEAEATANQILGFMRTQDAVISINNGSGLDEGSSQVSVTITVPMDSNSFLLPTFSSGMEMSATATMNTERYSGYYEPD